MVSVNFYFQVHQPFRLSKDFDFFSIGTAHPFEDDDLNRAIMNKVADRCYLPMNQLLLELIERFSGKFRISFSISGTALDQFAMYRPDVLESFQRLAKTGCVEFLGETYYHSLCSLYSETEFRQQVKMHRTRIQELFHTTPNVFRNTELIFFNELAPIVHSLGFKGILAEGADHIMGWRSPNFLYEPMSFSGHQLKLLLKNYRLSDDIAFRFSDRNWQEWPLCTDKYAHWLHQTAGNGETINLFMDYETFGEHQWQESGIFDFMRHLPQAILGHPDFEFNTPSEVLSRYEARGTLDFSHPVSWADTERDISAWVGNSLQNTTLAAIYNIESEVLKTKDQQLIHSWRKLQTSDHFYYMCIKWFNDGDVHRYFNPYASPYDAFILYTNALNQLRWWLSEIKTQNKKSTRAPAPKKSRSRSTAYGPTAPDMAEIPLGALAEK